MGQGFTDPRVGLGNDEVSNEKLRDSAALSVIGRSANSSGDPADIAGATVGHVLQVLSGPTVGFGASSGNGPEGSRYHPDRSPIGIYGNEQFPGGAETLTWRWGNQGSTTQTLHNDVSTLFTPNSTTNIRARWTTPPAGSFSFAAKLWGMETIAASGLAGIITLETGTEATPTALSGFFHQAKSTSPWGNYSAFTKTSYAGAYTSTSNDEGAETGYQGLASYLLCTYDTATKIIRYWWSHNGFDFRSSPSTPFKRTLGADPVSIGYFLDANNNTASTGFLMGVRFFRVWNSIITTDYLADNYAYASIGS